MGWLAMPTAAHLLEEHKPRWGEGCGQTFPPLLDYLLFQVSDLLLQMTDLVNLQCVDMTSSLPYTHIHILGSACRWVTYVCPPLIRWNLKFIEVVQQFQTTSKKFQQADSSFKQAGSRFK